MALDAVGQLKGRQLDVQTEVVFAHNPQGVLALKETARSILNIREALAIDDFERPDIEALGVQPDVVRYRPGVVGLDHAAGQQHRERLTDPNGVPIDPAPTLQGINLFAEGTLILQPRMYGGVAPDAHGQHGGG